MGAKIDLTGQKFNKLFVIEEIINTYPIKWKCVCECGTIKYVVGSSLKNNTTKSCGCIKKIIDNITGKKFNRLTIISRAEDIIESTGKNLTAWNCLCDCGNYKIIKAEHIKSGNVKSCGCISKEINPAQGKNMSKFNIKYSPMISSAKHIHTIYKDLSFDVFYRLSQLNCFYCERSPKKLFNSFKLKSYFSNVNDGNFIYNGLDRVNNNLGHIEENVITCCHICNMIKREKHFNYFFDRVDRISKLNHISVEEYREKSNNIKITNITSNIRKTFNNTYSDGNITIEQFYKLSQLNCYYCNIEKSNICNRNKKEIFIYNGLDRIDNLKSHNYDNVITSCWHCNFGKNNYHIDEFFSWINNIKIIYKDPNKIEMKRKILTDMEKIYGDG